MARREEEEKCYYCMKEGRIVLMVVSLFLYQVYFNVFYFLFLKFVCIYYDIYSDYTSM